MLLTKLIFATPLENGAPKGVRGTRKRYERMGKTIMRKIRVIAFLLALLMVFATFAACAGGEDPSANNGGNNGGNNGSKDECSEGGNHNWKKATTVQRRSCTQSLITKRECRDCGKEETIVDKAGPLGHRFDSAEKTFNHDATCTADGTYVTYCIYGCEDDDAVRVEAAPDTALGHRYLTFRVSDDGYSEVAQCVRCTQTTERLLGVKIDMNDRTHTSYSALKVLTPAGSAAPAETDFIKIGNNTVLHISRPAADYLGVSEFGAVVSPRPDILMTDDYVYETTVKLDKTATGELHLVRGYKAYLNQKLTFVKYVPGIDATPGHLETLDGRVYNLTDADYETALTVAVVINDAKRIYDVYVNNQLVTPISVSYGSAEYYSGLPLGAIGTVTVSGNTASTVDVASIYVYNASQPKGFAGATNLGYGIYITEYTEQRITYKLGNTAEDHNHSFDNIVKTVAADCFGVGYTVTSCACGGENITDVLEPLQHAWGETITIPATCTESGYEVKECTNCGTKDGLALENKLSHELGEEFETIEPNCTDIGYKVGPCKNCGEEYKVVIPSLGHELGEVVEVVDPTCTEGGYTHGECIRCQVDYTDPSTKVPAHGHFAEAPVKHVMVGCDNDGYDLYECEICSTVENKVEYKLNVIPAKGHKLYSVEQTVAGVTKLVTYCINCDYNQSKNVKKTIPTFAEMQKTYGDKLMNNQYANDEASAPGETGNLATENNGVRYATWKNGMEGKDRYAILTTAATSSLPAGYTSNHAHRDFSFSGSHTEDNKLVVVELDLKHPTSLASNEINGGINIQIIERTTTGSANAFTPITVKENGDIVSNNVTVGKVKTDKWTKIAIVMDPASKTFTTYIDGSDMVTGAIPEKYATHFQSIRVNHTRNASKNAVIYLNSMYLYYADEPAYIAGIPDYDDFSKVDDGVYGNVTHVNDDPYDKNPDSKVGDDYIRYLNSNERTSFFEYKPHSWLKVVERQGDDGNNYKTLNIRNGDDIPSPDGYDLMGNKPYSGEENKNFDSYICVQGLEPKGTYNVSMDVRFNSLTGRATIVNGRRAHTAVNNSSFKSYDYITYKDGVISVRGVEVWKIEVEGESVTIDLFDRLNENEFDVYINGYLVVEDCSYADDAYTTVEDPTAKISLTALWYKIFNLGSYNYTLKDDNGEDILDDEYNPVKGTIDVDIDRLDVFGGPQAPSYFEGRMMADVIIKDEFTNTVVSFDENSHIANYYPDTAKIAGMYSISGSKLVPNAVSVTPGNMRITKITANGKVDAGADEAGTYALGFNDLVTNGTHNQGAFVFKDLPGVPYSTETKTFIYNDAHNDAGEAVTTERPYTTSGGYYDLSGYTTLTITYYIDNPNNHKWGMLFFLDGFNVQEYQTSNGKVQSKPTYFSVSLSATPGWHTQVVNLATMGGSRQPQITAIKQISMQAFNWGGTGYNNGGKADSVADGFGYYLASISFSGNTTTVVEGSGYTTDGRLCTDNHVFDATKEVTVPATATSIGYTIKECSECGYKETIKLPVANHDDLVKADANAHVITVITNTPATSSANGVYEYTCSCGFGEKKTIKKHIHTFVDGQDAEHVNTPSTCTEIGLAWLKCSSEDCDLIVDGVAPLFTIETPALGHELGETVEVVAPTCIDQGYTHGACVRCGIDYIDPDSYVDATGHSIGENTVIKVILPGTEEDPVLVNDCTVAREKWAYGCAVCDAKWLVEEIPASKHTYDRVDVVAADCLNDGVQIDVCVDCGDIVRDEEATMVVIDGTLQYPYKEYTVPAKGHKAPIDGSLITIIPLSCTSDSGRYYVCTVCNEDVFEYDGNELPDHEYGEWIDLVVANCGVDGFKDKYCANCDGAYSDTLSDVERETQCVTEASGEHAEYAHEFSSDDEYAERTEYDICTVCGDKKNIVHVVAKYDPAATPGFTFKKDSATGAYLLVDYDGDATELVIPGTYSGAPVVVAFSEAYANVTKVTLLEGAMLGEGAFKNWTALEEVVLPESVTVIPAYAFSGCTSIEAITLPQSCTAINAFAFSGCSALTTMTIEGVLTTVQQYAFDGCAMLDRVYYVKAERPDLAIEAVGNKALYRATWVAIASVEE